MTSDARSDILNAAAQHFAVAGYSGASVRDIAESARVGLSAVHYHYESKAGLYRAVYRHWADSVAALQRDALRAALAGEAGSARRAEIIEAYIRPIIDQACEPGMLVFLLTTGRAFLEPGRVPRDEYRKLEMPVIDEFVSALADTVSGPRALVERIFQCLATQVKYALFDPTYASATGRPVEPADAARLADILTGWADGVLAATLPDKLLVSAEAPDGSIPAVPDDVEISTKDAILDAGQRAFARAGYRGASMRDILRQSRANASSAYHFFGGKEGVYLSVIERGLAPLCAERERNIAALDLARLDEASAIAAILYSWVAPHLQLWTGVARADYMRIIVRLNYDPIELVQDIHKRLLFAVRARHIAALRRVIPELDDEMAARLMGLAILHMCLAPFRMDNLAKPAYRFGSDVADHLVDAVVREGAAGILSVARKIRSGAIVRVV